MARLLNTDITNATETANSVADFIRNDIGLAAEDAIPGLVATIALLAFETDAPEQALDEAADLLSMIDSAPEGDDD